MTDRGTDKVVILETPDGMSDSIIGELRIVFHGSPDEVRVWLEGYPYDNLLVWKGMEEKIVTTSEYLKME